jgi:hypothetical protein
MSALSPENSGKAWITDDMQRCPAQRINIENKFWDTLRTTGEKKYLVVKYAFVPPNLVMVHMEDITLQKEAEASALPEPA